MSDENLPIGANDHDPRLPARRGPEQGTLALRPAGTALDLFEEPRRDEDEKLEKTDGLEERPVMERPRLKMEGAECREWWVE